MKTLTRIIQVILVVAIPVMVLFAPLYVFVTDAFVRHEYGLADMPSSARFTDSERLSISHVMIDFLRGRATADDLANIALADGTAAVNEREISHMQDVRYVMDGLYDAAVIAAGVVLVLVLYLLYRAERRELASAIRGGIWLGAVIIAGIVAASLINFDVFFEAFHGLFFQSGTWLFYAQDTLIQLYPEPFWMDAVWKYGVAIAIELAVLFGLSAFLIRYTPDIERM